ncbi:uncharacterized protein MYCFIDRAFT_175689 [Pseudocercospora fijiensis CIRAD86]|uniref:Uncharacterized protein n=1 Tax=Pseudocercospora fijiensis (strain CIRAD86) TaxID=383855 RepID=M2YWP7_PSEFD|nr:uncharacterized protein MYCFIDRAFT_175689 [Pseudocercospora fijiensis CIRAD86]EME82145.1 hypothetical protein MYCFIDRAFT_175689 [Pseudocercospora fijiensis CIRAD86]
MILSLNKVSFAGAKTAKQIHHVTHQIVLQLNECSSLIALEHPLKRELPRQNHESAERVERLLQDLASALYLFLNGGHFVLSSGHLGYLLAQLFHLIAATTKSKGYEGQLRPLGRSSMANPSPTAIYEIRLTCDVRGLKSLSSAFEWKGKRMACGRGHLLSKEREEGQSQPHKRK